MTLKNVEYQDADPDFVETGGRSPETFGGGGPVGCGECLIRRITDGKGVRPDFNGFYEFVRDDYRRMIEQKKVREKDFDIDGFLNVLEPFYRGGDYDFLLNSDRNWT